MIVAPCRLDATSCEPRSVMSVANVADLHSLAFIGVPIGGLVLAGLALLLVVALALGVGGRGTKSDLS
jgi:hypothetical protein